MKYRTVTVAVYPIRDPQSNRTNVPLPPATVLQSKLDETFGVQLNAWISLDYRPQQNFDYDPDGDGYVTMMDSTSVTQIGELPQFNVTDAAIRVFVIDNVHMRARQENINDGLNSEIYGLADIPAWTVVVNAGNPSEGVNSNQSVVDTIAHEIGHLLVGEGHPSDYNIELEFGGNHAGPAPLPGTDTSLRLMSGRDARVPGARLLVKTEWDFAEDRLISRPYGDD